MPDIFDGSFRCKVDDIFISSCSKATRNEGYFPLSREIRRNYLKIKEQTHTAPVTNESVPMVKNIELTN